MPDLPTIDPKVAPQVQPSADLPMDVTPASLGAGIGEAEENAAEVATKLHRDAVERANQTAVLDADNQKNAFLQSRLYDPKSGILYQNLGKDAPGAVDQTLADYDAHTAKVADGLTNDEQKIQFQRMAQATRFDMERQLAHYEHGETTRYAAEVDQAAIAGTTNAAVHNAHDPEQVGVELQKQQAIIADAGRRNGLPPEAIAEQQAKAASATHLAVLDHLTATGQDVAAQQWYDAHKDALVGRDLTQADNLVKAGTLAGEAQRTTETVLYTKDGEIDSRANIDARVRAIQDPKLQDEVQTRVNARLAQHRQEVDEQERSDFESAAKIVQGTPGGIYDSRVVAAMAKLPLDRREQLQRLAAHDAPEFSAELYQLRGMVGTPAFENVDLTKYRGIVPDAKLDDLAKTQADQRRNGPSGARVSDTESDNRILANALKNLSLDRDGDQNSDEALKFRNRYDKAKAYALLANGGKPLSGDAKEAIAKALYSDHMTQVAAGWFRGAHEAADGKLYTKDDDTVLASVAHDPGVRANLTVPETASAVTGEGMSYADLDGWVKALSAPEVGAATKAQLERMSQGKRADGTPDPSLVARYQAIRAAVRAAKAGR